MSRLRALIPAALTTAAAALAVVPAGASAAGCGNAGLVPTRANVDEVRQSTLCLLNAERRRHGLPRLREHRTLEHVATDYSRAMVRQKFFAHVSPGGSTLTSRIKRTSYLRGANGWAIGENLAWGSGSRATPRDTVRAWMRSPGHRRNILDRRFREIGIGVALGAPVRLRAASTAATYTTEFGRRG